MRLCGRNALLLGSTGQRQRSTGSCGEGTAPHRAVGWWRRGTWNLDTHARTLVSTVHSLPGGLAGCEWTCQPVKYTHTHTHTQNKGHGRCAGSRSRSLALNSPLYLAAGTRNRGLLSGNRRSRNQADRNRCHRHHAVQTPRGIPAWHQNPTLAVSLPPCRGVPTRGPFP